MTATEAVAGVGDGRARVACVRRTFTVGPGGAMGRQRAADGWERGGGRRTRTKEITTTAATTTTTVVTAVARTSCLQHAATCYRVTSVAVGVLHSGGGRDSDGEARRTASRQAARCGIN